MPPHKRQKLAAAEQHHSESGDDDSTPFEASGSEDEVDDDGMDTGSDNEVDEDEEIENLKPQKSKQTSKRKIRATAGSKFGATLEFLLKTETPSALPLSLKPSIARKRNDEKLESRARKVLQIEKKEKEDKARIKDVIGGWGGESERALRKVAQRGGTSRRFFSSRVDPYFSLYQQLSDCSTLFSNPKHLLLPQQKKQRPIAVQESLHYQHQ